MVHKRKPLIEDFISWFTSSVGVSIANFEIKLFPRFRCAKIVHGALKLSKYGFASCIEQLRCGLHCNLTKVAKTKINKSE